LLLRLQRSAGNAAVGRLLARQPGTADPASAPAPAPVGIQSADPDASVTEWTGGSGSGNES
jgi:hypothetical protein